MAYRDKLKIDVLCSSCGKGGGADVSENDYPGRKNPGFNYDRLPHGFSVFEQGIARQETILLCKCGNKFVA